MIKTLKFGCGRLRGGTALRALALLGAGVTTTVIMPAPAAAQDFTNLTASGRVTDASGNGIAGATVLVRSNNQGFERTVTTDSSGGYRVPQLPSGVYTFVITGPDGATFTDANVELGQDTAANTFELGTAAGVAGADGGAEIVVTGRRVRAVDFERTTTGAVIELGDLATRVPVARDLTSVVLLAPGTTQGDSAFGNLPNIRGGSVAENAYFINGLNITDFRNGLGSVPVPFDFYQTVDIKTGGFPAEFGRATGGIINAITKSGSNEFHGGILFNWEPDDLRSNTDNTLFADNDSDFAERTDTVIQLSGPIIKDRLFVYGIYNFRDVKTTNGSTIAAGGPDEFVVTGNNVLQDRNSSPFYGAKVDFIPIDGQRLEFTYFNTSSTTTRTIFGTAASGRRFNPTTNDPGGFDSQVLFRGGGENYVGRYTGTFTDWLTVSAAYGKNKSRDTTESTTPDLPSIINQLPGAGNRQLGNASANRTINFDERTFYRADADVRFDFLGSHHIRGGYDREELESSAATTANGGAQITILQSTAATVRTFGIPLGTQYIRSRFFLNGGDFSSLNEAYYLQDSWQLFDNRLTLQLGVRNDRFSNANADGDVFYKSGNQWAPRLGFAFDPTGDNRTKIYGNYGRYFLPVAANTNVRLAGTELDFERYNLFGGFGPGGRPISGAELTVINGRACPDGSGASCRIRADGVVASTESTVAKNLKSQAIDEYILGAEHRFNNRIRLGLFYTRTRLLDALEDAAIDPAVRAFCASINNVACANIETSAFSGTHQYVLINPGRNATVTLSDVLPGETAIRTVELSAEDLRYPKAERKYDAVTLTVDRDYDGTWSLGGSYTYSKLRGNYEGGVKSDNGQDDTGLTTDFDLPGLSLGSFGPSPNDRRHNIKLYGSYQVLPWLSLGANFSAVSQRKYGCIGTVNPDIDADAFNFYGAEGNFCNLDAGGNVIIDPAIAVTTDNLQLTPRGSQFKSDWLTNTNLDLVFRVPSELFQGTFRVSVLNVFDEGAKLDFIERGTDDVGTPNPQYRQVTRFQTGRQVRLQLGVNF